MIQGDVLQHTLISVTLGFLLLPSLSPDFGKVESQHCQAKQTGHNSDPQHFVFQTYA